MNRIYSYYESFPMRKQEEEFQKANIWKATWEKHGWQTSMLNNSHAKSSPHVQKLVAKLLRMANEMPIAIQNNFQPVMVRFLRVAALHAAGGGWYCDYDVVNCGFTPAMAQEIAKENSVFLFGEPKSSLIFATSAIAGACVLKIASGNIVENEKLKSDFEIFSAPRKKYDFLGKIVHVQSVAGEKKSDAMKKIAES